MVETVKSEIVKKFVKFKRTDSASSSKLKNRIRNRTFLVVIIPGGARGGGRLPSERLMGMCRWMWSHFHDWIGYDGVALFFYLRGKTILYNYG